MFTKYSLVCLSLISCYTLPHTVQEELRNNAATQEATNYKQPVIQGQTVDPHEIISTIYNNKKESLKKRKILLSQMEINNKTTTALYFNIRIGIAVTCVCLLARRNVLSPVVISAVLYPLSIYAKGKSMYKDQDFYNVKDEIQKNSDELQKLELALAALRMQHATQ